jgi:flagellar biosynthesis/type III secretory pathway protein FliH
MVKAIDNIVTGAPLRDIRLVIGPAEALLKDSDRFEEPADPSLEDQLRESDAQGYSRGCDETAAEYEKRLQVLRQELEETQHNTTENLLDKIENKVQENVQERLRELEGELVEFAAEAAIRLVNGLPISTDILEASIIDALKHCENDIEVSVHLNSADLKMLKESGSELLSDSPHQRRVRYLKDEEVSRGGCLVETRCGVIDGRRETREKILRETVNT